MADSLGVGPTRSESALGNTLVRTLVCGALRTKGNGRGSTLLNVVCRLEACWSWPGRSDSSEASSKHYSLPTPSASATRLI
jgi:hypothetical protein